MQEPQAVDATPAVLSLSSASPAARRAAEGARVARVYDEIAAYYDRWFQGPVARAEDQAVAGLLHTLVAGLPVTGLGRTVLDLGCGTGLLLSLAPPLPSRSYVGIDISSMMLDRARQNHPGYTFRWGDIREPIPLPRATVGLLACLYGPASYCADPLGVLEAQLPLLAPGGRFLFMLLAPAYRGRMSHIAPTELVTLLDRQQIVHRLGPLVAAGRIRYTLRPFSPAVTLPVSDRWPARAVLVPLLARLAGLGFRLSDRWGLTARRPYYWLVVGRRIA